MQTYLHVYRSHLHNKAELILISFRMCTELDVNRENLFSSFQRAVGFCGLVGGVCGVCVFFSFSGISAPGFAPKN